MHPEPKPHAALAISSTHVKGHWQVSSMNAPRAARDTGAFGSETAIEILLRPRVAEDCSYQFW
jgi:hypothetical protein